MQPPSRAPSRTGGPAMLTFPTYTIPPWEPPLPVSPASHPRDGTAGRESKHNKSSPGGRLDLRAAAFPGLGAPTGAASPTWPPRLEGAPRPESARVGVQPGRRLCARPGVGTLGVQACVPQPWPRSTVPGLAPAACVPGTPRGSHGAGAGRSHDGARGPGQALWGPRASVRACALRLDSQTRAGKVREQSPGRHGGRRGGIPECLGQRGNAFLWGLWLPLGPGFWNTLVCGHPSVGVLAGRNYRENPKAGVSCRNSARVTAKPCQEACT